MALANQLPAPLGNGTAIPAKKEPDESRLSLQMPFGSLQHRLLLSEPDKTEALLERWRISSKEVKEAAEVMSDQKPWLVRGLSAELAASAISKRRYASLAELDVALLLDEVLKSIDARLYTPRLQKLHGEVSSIINEGC